MSVGVGVLVILASSLCVCMCVRERESGGERLNRKPFAANDSILD